MARAEIKRNHENEHVKRTRGCANGTIRGIFPPRKYFASYGPIEEPNALVNEPTAKKPTRPYYFIHIL